MARPTPRFPLHWLLLAGLLLAAWWFWPRHEGSTATAPVPVKTAPAVATAPETAAARGPSAPFEPATQADALPAFLPAEAHQTIALILRDGPYPYRQDGGTFGNRERRLPSKPRGWYREFTVDTPGLSHRGARRIVTGGKPPREWYYTDDHYDSFRRFDVPETLQ